jgi:hypothetical protein
MNASGMPKSKVKIKRLTAGASAIEDQINSINDVTRYAVLSSPQTADVS